MPITFACPYCATPYKLRDELAGKKAKCRNPACGQLLTVPRPDPSVNGTAASSAEVEAAALAALADEAKEEVAAAQAIPMTCVVCEHKWTEPAERAGKNVLCPECRHRQKVPIPKGNAPVDWRVGSQGPSLAKENFERPDDIMGGEAKIVSQKSLEGAGATNVEYEPVPLKRKALWAALVLVPALLLAGGAWYAWTAFRNRGQDQFMAQAADEFAKAQPELPPAEGHLLAAVLHVAGGEYELQQDRDRKEALKQALNHLTKARSDLQQAAGKDDPKRPTGPERYAVAAELAAATLLLGGTDDEVRAEARIRWVPEVVTRALRTNERPRTVHQELGPTLQLVQPADLDLRVGLLRRLARELARRGQGELAAGQLPGMLFGDAERPEARAWAALEVYRADNGSAAARAVADDLRSQAEKGTPGGPAAQLLWRAYGIEKSPLPPDAANNDPGRLVAVGLLLIQGQPGEAVELARKPGGSAGGRLRALALCGEWGADPGAVAEAAAGVVEREAKGSGPPAVLVRLAQVAGAGGKPEAAKALAEAIPDEGLRAWAKGEAVRGGAGRADEALAEAPDDPKKVWAGHAWGRLWVARRNTKASGDGAAEKRAVDLWPATAKPFGLAGIALGLKDR